MNEMEPISVDFRRGAGSPIYRRKDWRGFVFITRLKVCLKKEQKNNNNTGDKISVRENKLLRIFNLHELNIYQESIRISD